VSTPAPGRDRIAGPGLPDVPPRNFWLRRLQRFRVCTDVSLTAK
jgi:hypothetical protein